MLSRHIDVFEAARLRSVSRVQENKLFTPPPFDFKALANHSDPDLGKGEVKEGGWGGVKGGIASH